MIKAYKSGKNMKWWFFAAGALRALMPRGLWNIRRRRILKGWQSRKDADYIRSRVDFYCPDTVALGASRPEECIASLERGRAQKAYYVDIERWLRYFPKHLRITWRPGDVFTNPDVPAIMKARRLDCPGAGNVVVMKLNSVRHFLTPHDNIPFSRKLPKLIFRGKIEGKPERIAFFEKFFGNPLMDIADTSRHPQFPQWNAPKMAVADHFKYQFVMVIEGNDVSSNLQWVMASNCVPVMSRPKVEHWLMHSRLKPGVHYVEVAPDWSDLEEKLAWYAAHPDEAEAIARASRQWAAQFANPRREKIIALLTLQKYFRLTGQ